MPSLLTSLCGYPSSVLNSASLRGLLPHQQPLPHLHRFWEWIHTCENVSTSLLGSRNPRGIQGREAKCIRAYHSLTHSVPPRGLLDILGLAPSTSCMFPANYRSSDHSRPLLCRPPSSCNLPLGPLGSLGFRGQKTSEEMDVHLREVPTTCGRNESGEGGEPLGPPANYQAGHFAICLQVLHQWITAAGSSRDSLYRDLRVCGENLANSPFLCTLCSFLDWLQWDCVCPLECP